MSNQMNKLSSLLDGDSVEKKPWFFTNDSVTGMSYQSIIDLYKSLKVEYKRGADYPQDMVVKSAKYDFLSAISGLQTVVHIGNYLGYYVFYGYKNRERNTQYLIIVGPVDGYRFEERPFYVNIKIDVKKIPPYKIIDEDETYISGLRFPDINTFALLLEAVRKDIFDLREWPADVEHDSIDKTLNLLCEQCLVSELKKVYLGFDSRAYRDMIANMICKNPENPEVGQMHVFDVKYAGNPKSHVRVYMKRDLFCSLVRNCVCNISPEESNSSQIVLSFKDDEHNAERVKDYDAVLGVRHCSNRHYRYESPRERDKYGCAIIVEDSWKNGYDEDKVYGDYFADCKKPKKLKKSAIDELDNLIKEE